MTRKERYKRVLEYFRREMPQVQTELHFGSTFQLLVAVVLSAQCTDKRVNMVTADLFRRYPDSRTLARADVDDVLELVRSVSYPNSKANHLVQLARRLAFRFFFKKSYESVVLVKQTINLFVLLFKQ